MASLGEKLVDAAKRGDMATVQKCLDAKADVNFKLAKKHDSTALMYASWYGHIDLVRLFLMSKADPNVRDTEGDTALMKAAYAGNVQVVQLLLAAGADVTIKGKSGNSARDWADKKKHAAVVALLDSAFQRKKEVVPMPQQPREQPMAPTPEPVPAPVPVAVPRIESVKALVDYVKSCPMDKTWHLVGNFYLTPDAVATSNHTIFKAINKKQKFTPYVVKLSTAEDARREIAFLNDMSSATTGNSKKHLVEVHDWDDVTIEGLACWAVVMEMGDLTCAELLQSFGDDHLKVLQCLKDTANAVGFMHSRGYIHGDIKLENVMHFGMVHGYKLIDFDHTSKFGDAIAFCTTEYCPPEMARYLQSSRRGATTAVVEPVHADKTFDIWCLGVMVLKMFLPHGELVEFRGLDGDAAILDVLAAPGFSFRQSISHAPLQGRQRKYLLRCLEPDPTRRASSVQAILELAALKTNSYTPVMASASAQLSACPLPCFWSIAVQHDKKKIPRGDNLRDLSCIVTMHASTVPPCTFATTDRVCVQADAAIVDRLLPHLKNLAAIAELVEEFDVWGLTTELPVANLPTFDHLDKTIKALESIHSQDSEGTLAQMLRPMIESLTHNSHRQDSVVQMQAHAIVAIHEFCADPASQASVGDLLDAFCRQFGGRGLWGLQKASGVWVCDHHATIHGGKAAQAPAGLSPLAEADDEDEDDDHNNEPLPCVWTVDGMTNVARFSADVEVLRAETFRIRCLCELHDDAVCDTTHDSAWEVQGQSPTVALALPLLNASSSILEALAVADCYDLALTTNHTMQFNLAHSHGSIVEKLQLIHVGLPPLAVQARLADLAQRLNGEEVEDDEAAVLMAEFSRVFAELRHGAPLAAILRSLNVSSDKTIGGLHKVQIKGLTRWVCTNHAAAAGAP
ncbi:Aste57867_19881 [Aphanomyces stellatus]|uniref:Aste57867_19881 protein n=1 Tax=Aphanomyces stellatus TaxID=120398 RepID=A0A485LEC3_9STRA|nr:hypothetical protein As57867_019815 [Aphanomyces stellatus]VFT96579.1 Aste57867_19881 [Aphanomyces stellatus]